MHAPCRLQGPTSELNNFWCTSVGMKYALCKYDARLTPTVLGNDNENKNAAFQKLGAQRRQWVFQNGSAYRKEVVNKIALVILLSPSPSATACIIIIIILIIITISGIIYPYSTPHTNFYFCPQVDCLRQLCILGDQSVADSCVTQVFPRRCHQWWRFVTSIYLHQGILDCLVITFLQIWLYWGQENSIGWLRMAIVHHTAGVGGHLVRQLRLSLQCALRDLLFQLDRIACEQGPTGRF